MKSKLVTWFYAVLCLSIFLRALFYLGQKLHVVGSIDGYDLAAGLIGLVSLYLSYMFLRKIFSGRNERRSES